MTILDRNSGVIAANSSTWNVTRSTGSYGTGTTIVVALFGNTVFNTPLNWTQRASSVVAMGLYAFDKVAAGEASIGFTNTAPGAGQWYAWELSAGCTWVGGSAAQTDTLTLAEYTCPNVTPTAGPRHLLAVAGGNSPSRSVTAWSNSFVQATGLNGGQTTAGDQSFSAGADRDVTADGVTAYNTTASFNTGLSTRGGMTLAYTGTVPDNTPPSVPTGLAVSAITSTGATLTWNASTDDVAVTGYEVQIIGP